MGQIYENARRKRQEEIIAAFWEQYKKMPIEKITVKSITDACQIHRATFYIHYQDVYEVLEQIENSLITALDKVSIKCFESSQDLDSFANALYAIFQDNREYLHYLVIENKHPEFSEKYKKKLKLIFPNIFQSERNKAKDKWIIDMTITGLVDIFLQGADNNLISIEEIILLVEGFMTRGIFDTLLNNFNIESSIDLRKEQYKGTKKD
ncbi:TetR/AcrR family transcriptional regulator [Clostridium saccharoperbutylacetonicum]